MKPRDTRDPRVLHSTPGRLRVRLARENGPQSGTLEDQLCRLPGVTQARLNPVTGNVLIHFNPQRISQDTILATLTVLESGGADSTLESLPLASRIEDDTVTEGPIVPARLLRAASLLVDRKLPVTLKGSAAVAAAAPLLQESPLVNQKLGRLLGGNLRDVLFSLASILTNLLTAHPLRIALAGVEAFLLLSSLFDTSSEATLPTTPSLSLHPRAA